MKKNLKCYITLHCHFIATIHHHLTVCLSVCLSVHGGPHKATRDLFKLAHLGTPQPQTLPYPHGDTPIPSSLDLFKFDHYVAHTSISKRELGFRLKGFLV